MGLPANLSNLIGRIRCHSFCDPSGGGIINENCGSEHLEDLRDLVLENNADLGIAHDGDGDRVRSLTQRAKSWMEIKF